MRKDSGFDVTDRIELVVGSGKEIDKVLLSYGERIASEVLANKITRADKGAECDLGGIKVKLSVNKL